MSKKKSAKNKNIQNEYKFFNEKTVIPESLCSILYDFCLKKCRENDVMFKPWDTRFGLNKNLTDCINYRDPHFKRHWMDKLCIEFENMLWCSIFNARGSERGDEKKFENLANKACSEFKSEFS